MVIKFYEKINIYNKSNVNENNFLWFLMVVIAQTYISNVYLIYILKKIAHAHSFSYICVCICGDSFLFVFFAYKIKEMSV